MDTKEYVFGIDVGGTSIKIGLFDINGELEGKWQISTDTNNRGKNILLQVANHLDLIINEKNIKKSQILGIGVGVPGPVDEDGVVYSCVNLGWGVFNIEKELSEITGLPVKAANDANAAALGEMHKGAGQGFKNLVLITIGTGIGGGIIVNGEIITGAKGSAGEIGHMTVNSSETTYCSCGKKGCVEQYASATGMVNMAKKLIVEGEIETSLKDDGSLTAKRLIEYAKNGDSLASEILEIMGETLGVALSNTACVFNPQLIVLGGGVSEAGEIIRSVIEKHFRKFAFHAVKDTPIVLSKLGNDAGIYGASMLEF